ncbi:MAG: hypothetical protein HY817_01445 [Candidatus Abawacabacteria bacterium]|nr:hypothetical protein [Candidatus Abawacabacteria bacterium]
MTDKIKTQAKRKTIKSQYKQSSCIIKNDNPVTFKEYLAGLVAQLTSQDMPNEDLSYIFETCGREVAISLIEHCGGSQISIPSSAFKELEKRYIRESYAKAPSRTTILRLVKELKTTDKLIAEVLKCPDENGCTQLKLLDALE